MSGPFPVLLAYLVGAYVVRLAVLSVGAPKARRRRYALFAVVETAAFLGVVLALWGRVPTWVAALAAVALLANLVTARFCGRCGKKTGGRGGTRCGACGGKLLAAWA